MADNGGAVLGQQLGQLLFGRTDPSAFMRGQQAGASVQDSLAAARLARAKAINQEGQNEAITGLGDAAAKLGLTPDQAAGFQGIGQAGGGDALALAKAIGALRGQGFQSDARTAALGGDLNTANANLVGLADKPLELSKLTDGQVYNPLVTPGTAPVVTTPLGQADIALKNAQAAKGSFVPDIPNGDGTTSAGFIDPLNRTFSPITLAPGGLGSLGAAVMQQESGGNPNALSPKGAMGLMQLMPETAANPGFGIQPARDGSPQENQRVGTQYLSALMSKYGGNTPLALAAYNAGPGRVDAALQQAGGDPHKAIALLPAETQDYVPAVLNNLGSMGGDSGLGVSVGMGGGSAPDVPSTTMARSPKLAFGQAPASSKAANLPIGYRNRADGSGLEPVPGGPADKSGVSAVSLGDPQKTGDAYLASIADPSMQAQIQAIAEGRMPLPKVSRPGKNGEISPQTIQQAVAQYDPTYDQADPSSRIKARNDFTSGKSAVQLRQLNTLLGHIGGLADAADKLDNGGSTIVNGIENAVGKTYNTKVSNFEAAARPAAEEFAALLKGGVPSVEEIKAAHEMLSANKTPEQLHGVIGTMAAQIQSRISALNAMAKNSLGPFANKVTIVTPEGQAALDKLRERGLIGKFDLGEEDAGQPATPPGGHAVGDIITHAGKQYRVTGGDPNDPDVELVQ